MCSNELMFVDCSIYGNMTYDHVVSCSAQGIYVNGNVSFTQCAGQWWNFSEITGTLTLAFLAADPHPLSDPANYGWSPYDGKCGDINMLTEGKVDAKNHTVTGIITLNTPANIVNLVGCPVATINNVGLGTVNNVGDYYDKTVKNILVSDDVQAAIDELADRDQSYSGAGNPNGVVSGQFPQHYLDTGTNTPYINTGLAPNNNLWAAI
jgi:hypothetical protein